MKNKLSKSNEKVAEEAIKPASVLTIQPGTLPEEAFLKEAENEPKRILLADHTQTIRTLRDKKRLTFRAIAEWFGERGVETDQSAIYRAYCACFPKLDDYGNPVEVEDEQDGIDEYENVKLKKLKV